MDGTEETSWWLPSSATLDSFGTTVSKVSAIANKIDNFGQSQTVADTQALANEIKRQEYQKQLKEQLSNTTNSSSFDSNTLLWVGGGILAFMLLS